MSFYKKIAPALLATTLVATSAIAQAEELKLAHFSSTKHPLHKGLFLPLTEQIAKETGGSVTMRVYPGGELGKGPQKQYDRVLDGVADIVFGLQGYTASHFPKSLIVELPGVLQSQETSTDKIWDNIGQLDKEYRRVKLLGLWTNPPSVIMTRDKPIHTLEDLKGLKLRVSSRNVGKVAQAWGASPVSMPITEVYNSLATGVIDGVLVDPSVLISFKLSEVVNHITTGMDSTSSPFYLLMNLDSWKDLSDSEQASLTKITQRNGSEKARQIAAAAGVRSMKKFKGMGKQIIALSAEESQKFNAASSKLLKDIVEELDDKGKNASQFVSALR